MTVAALGLTPAAAEPMAGGKWRDATALGQASEFVQAHCAGDFDDADLRALKPKAASIDEDGKPDYYADVPTDLVQAKQCDPQTIRFTWLSSEGFAFTEPSNRHASGAEASPQRVADAVEAKPSEAQNPEASETDPSPGPDEPAKLEEDVRIDAGEPPSAHAPPTSATAPSNRMLVLAIGGGVAAFALIAAIIAMSRHSVARYGYPLVWNKVNFLYLVFAACIWLGITFGGPIGISLLTAAALTYLTILICNVRGTSLVFGLAATIIQPLLVISVLFGIYWLTNFMRNMSRGHSYDRA